MNSNEFCIHLQMLYTSSLGCSESIRMLDLVRERDPAAFVQFIWNIDLTWDLQTIRQIISYFIMLCLFKQLIWLVFAIIVILLSNPYYLYLEYLEYQFFLYDMFVAFDFFVNSASYALRWIPLRIWIYWWQISFFPLFVFRSAGPDI